MSSRRHSSDKSGRPLVRKDSRDVSKEPVEEYHPTLLRKAEPPKADEVKNEAEKPPTEVPLMKTSIPIVCKGKIDNHTISIFMEPENSNYYVVGVVGMKDSGKSTVMNLIANGTKTPNLDENGNVIGGAPVFMGRNKLGIDAFITSSRVILLDSSPIMSFSRNRAFIAREADDLRHIQLLFRVCHELVIVYEPHQLMNLMRMLFCARNMMQPYPCGEQNITLIENRGQNGCLVSPMGEIGSDIILKSRITNKVHRYRVPYIDTSMPQHEDPFLTIERLRDDINTRKELKTYEAPQDTEKSWLERLGNMNFNCEDLVQRYEGVCEKFHQKREY